LIEHCLPWLGLVLYPCFTIALIIDLALLYHCVSIAVPLMLRCGAIALQLLTTAVRTIAVALLCH